MGCYPNKNYRDKVQFDGKTIVNLGDKLLNTDEWKSINSPDVLIDSDWRKS